MGHLIIIFGIAVIVAGLGLLAEDSVLDGIIAFCFGGTLLWIGNKLRKKTLRTPEQATRYIVEHFDEISEQEIGKAETEVKRAKGNHPEASLLYALRVSKCVPTLKSFKTLASRWSTANCGVGAAGLQFAQGAKNWQLVNDFLTQLYLKRYETICADLIQKTAATIAKRKSEQAKLNAIQKASDKISEASSEFMYELPDLALASDHCLSQLAALTENLGE